MGFEENLLLAIVDKLLIGILVLIVAFWLNARLEKLKGQIELGKAISLNRANAYAGLWQLTEPLSPRRKDEIREENKKKIKDALISWYYEQGNAMYLSFDAADLFLEGVRLLEDDLTNPPPDVKQAFSKLRTQLKVDIGIYSISDAKTPLIKKPDPEPDPASSRCALFKFLFRKDNTQK